MTVLRASVTMLDVVGDPCTLCNKNDSGDPYQGGMPGYVDDGHCPWCGGTTTRPGVPR